MKRLLILFVLLIGIVLTAEVVEIPLNITKATDDPVPVTIDLKDLLDIVGFDVDVNWNSLKIVDAEENVAQFQIDDLDKNGKLSSDDILMTLLEGPAKIVLSEDDFTREIIPCATIEDTEDGILITFDNFKALVNRSGLVRIVEFMGNEGTIVDEIGTARVAGWVGSTYYVDGSYGNSHQEKTSGDFIVENMEVNPAGNVGVTVYAKLRSPQFVGLNQIIKTTIFKNGYIVVDTIFEFENYQDLMKLQPMITRPITDISDDSVHILPTFRRLLWADQLNSTPWEYWSDRGASLKLNDKLFTVFPATDAMRPLWWGATYIYASEENWRSNYSPSMKIGIAEILPEKPLVYADYEKWVRGPQWIYESREFRDGYFMWIPGEFQAYPSTEGIAAGGWEDYVMHFKAGDEMEFYRYFKLFHSEGITEAINTIEELTHEIQSYSIGE